MTVIFGHTPTVCFQEGKPLEIFRRSKLIGIDCGAGWLEGCGGRLACIRLDDMKMFYSHNSRGRFKIQIRVKL